MATETAAPAAGTEDPVVNNTMASLLGLVEPDKATVKPPPALRSSIGSSHDDDEDEVPKKQPETKVEAKSEATPTSGAKPETDKKKDVPPKTDTPPAKAAADDAAKSSEGTGKSPAAPKKVVVKTPEPSVAETVKQALKEGFDSIKPRIDPVKEEAAKPAVPAVPDDSDLTVEEKDELALAVYAESKDPVKHKGLAAKFRTFYKEQKAFLEDKVSKAAEEGETYDPTKDPAYQKFLAAKEPKLSAGERKQLYHSKIVEDTRAETLRELTPKLTSLERKTMELENRPLVVAKLNSLVNEIAAGASPPEIVKFYNENGHDIDKTKARYPLEYKIIDSVITGASALAEEFLAVRSGYRVWDPNNNERHRFLDTFVNKQATEFERTGGALLIRDGKRFVHPFKFRPEMAVSNWTLNDDDILNILRIRAQKEALSRIESARRDRLAEGFVPKGEIAAPESAAKGKEAAPVDKDTQSSPRTTTTPLPGAAAAEVPKADIMTKLLGLG